MKKWLVRILLFVVFCVLAGAGLLMYGYYIEPNRLTYTDIDIEVPEWKGTDKRLKIVVAGDFHAKPGEEERLQKTVKAILEQEPDLILLLGDYCNGHRRAHSMSVEEIAKYLASLHQQAPTFGILGNHDAYYGEEIVREALEEAGIQFIDKESMLLMSNDTHIQLAGMPDASTKRLRPNNIPTRVAPNIPMIVITHSPDAILQMNDQANFTLAGHTHGGQICLPWGQALMNASHIDLKYSQGDNDFKGKRLIVTRGLGTSILPLRLFCPPEIMILHLHAPGLK